MHYAGSRGPQRAPTIPGVQITTMHRVSTALCPACDGANAASARYCSHCGTVLIMRCPACDAVNARTREHCHLCAASLRPTAGADEGPIVPLLVPAGVEPVTLDWRLDLREPDTTPAVWPGLTGSDTVGPSAAANGASRLAAPELVGDPDAPRHGPAADPVAKPPGRPSPADLAGAKAQRRAAVRRSQLRRRAAASTAAPAVDVLVLEANAEARVQLCSLLEVFGFRPHVAVSVAEAEGLSLRRTHVAAFLGLGDDVGSTAEFCRRLHDAPRGRPSAVIAISERDRHADRVRLQLAGADQTIFRPLARGDVARALDACGLTLPHDPRQGAAPDR